MVLVAAVAVIAVVLVPYLVARRAAITQSREFDRFSPRMRLLRTDPTPQPEEPSPAGAQRLLGSVTVHPPVQVPGVTMTSSREHRGSHRHVAGAQSTHGTGAVREAAQLRAHRAARLARERAASQRRFLSSLVCVLGTVVVVGLAAASVVGWVWVAVPGALLLAALVLSRRAAVRSEAAGRAESERMRELRARIRSGHEGDASADQDPAGVREAPTGRVRDAAAGSVAGQTTAGAVAGQTTADVDGHPTAVGRPAAEEDLRGALADGASHDAGVPDDLTAADDAGADADGQGPVDPTGATPGGSVAEREEGTPSSREGTPEGTTTLGGAGTDVVVRTPRAAEEHRTWNVIRVPAPTYATRARVSGRDVHADTDIRGIPRVDAAVPARPVAAGPVPTGARSTSDVVADQPVAFDLEAVLDARRAQ